MKNKGIQEKQVIWKKRINFATLASAASIPQKKDTREQMNAQRSQLHMFSASRKHTQKSYVCIMYESIRWKCVEKV